MLGSMKTPFNLNKQLEAEVAAILDKAIAVQLARSGRTGRARLSLDDYLRNWMIADEQNLTRLLDAYRVGPGRAWRFVEKSLRNRAIDYARSAFNRHMDTEGNADVETKAAAFQPGSHDTDARNMVLRMYRAFTLEENLNLKTRRLLVIRLNLRNCRGSAFARARRLPCFRNWPDSLINQRMHSVWNSFQRFAQSRFSADWRDMREVDQAPLCASHMRNHLISN